MKASIVIPAYNEEMALGKVAEEVESVMRNTEHEVIIVDDGSRDKTYEIAVSLSQHFRNIKVLKHENNLGKVAAIRTGIANASGEIIILTDADFTYPAQHMLQMIQKIEEGNDLVLGSRFLGEIEDMSFANRAGNLIFSFLISYFSGKEIKDGQTGFRAFRKSYFEKLDVKARGLEFETKQTIKAAKLGYKIAEVPIKYRKRIGSSKLNPLKDGYRMLKAIFDIAASETSTLAKVLMLPSVPLFIAGVLFGLIALQEKFFLGKVAHEYYPLISTLFILVAIQLFSLGVILDNLNKKLDRIEEELRRR